jgi:hypothetical protein
MAESAQTARPPFPNYTQIPTRVPGWVWPALRVASVAAALAVAALLAVNPARGLALLWQVLVPSLPLVMLVVPGLWRNLCPMAALNQLPRRAGFTCGLAHTPQILEYSFVVGIALFFVLVSSRKWLFGLGGAFLGGLVFKGKSGWCSSICPLLPVQHLFGQAPFAVLPNAHCKPCVGCTKNCYDFNPSIAYLADQYDDDRHCVGDRTYREPVAFTILKVVGADVASVGRCNPDGDGDQVIVHEDAAEYKYRKLVVDRSGRLAGAILIGHPTLMSGVTGAVKAQRDVTAELASLKVGDWSALEAV